MQAKEKEMEISFSVSVAAQKIGLCERTLRLAIRDRRLRAIRVGRRVLLTDAALHAFLRNPTGGANHVGH